MNYRFNACPETWGTYIYKEQPKLSFCKLENVYADDKFLQSVSWKPDRSSGLAGQRSSWSLFYNSKLQTGNVLAKTALQPLKSHWEAFVAPTLGWWVRVL